MSENDSSAAPCARHCSTLHAMTLQYQPELTHSVWVDTYLSDEDDCKLPYDAIRRTRVALVFSVPPLAKVDAGTVWIRCVERQRSIGREGRG